MESNKKRIIIFGVVLSSVLFVFGGITYAFFSNSIGESKNEVVKMQVGTLALVFTDNDTLGNIEKKLNFGDTIEKELKIENTGSLDAYAKISWNDLTNTFLDGSLTYTLEYKTSETDIYKPIEIKNNKVPVSGTPSKQLIIDKILIPSKTTYFYRIVITYNDLDIDQTSDLNATFKTKFTLDEGTIPSTSVMVAREYSTSTEKIWTHSANIKKIVFEDRLNPKTNSKYTYDMSENQDGKVMSYLVPTEEDSTKYTLYIQGEHGVVANSNSSYLFSNFTNLESIDGINYLDTSNVTRMVGMFSGCNSLTSLNLSNFDTSNVTHMISMFYNCRNLTSLDVSSFDTSNVTDMSNMFMSCNKLTLLNVNNFDTSKVTRMNQMFNGCSALTSLDISSFDTSNVTDMFAMFYNCSSLTSLDVNNFDTNKVTEMASMFCGCSALTSLDLSNFKTDNVTRMAYMFQYCSSLTSLNVSNFNTNNITDMDYMFNFCRSLTSLDLNNFNTKKVTNMSYMFNNCSSLETLNLKNFNVSAVTNSTNILASISSTIKITVSNTTIRTWLINASTSPKLSTTNFIIKA